MTDLEQRIIELETKVAYQDETIEILNDEIKSHQVTMAKMQRQLELMAGKVKDLQPSSVASMAEETPPPHY